jgi:beta-fructofuranosidase
MSLRLADKWVWDFWLVQKGGEHHIFYLQAPRTLEQPVLRHHHATVGHAVSADLTNWQILPDALGPGAPGSWDDLAIWTGSAIQHDGCFYMLYTGVNRDELGLIERIGLAFSVDLKHWVKHRSNPVIEADPRWYEMLDLRRWRNQSWRDPWLFKHPDDGAFHALITARSPSGSPDGAGVIGHALSIDLFHWKVQPPLTQPGEFAQVEVPQLVHLDGRYEILFSCHAEDHSRARAQRLGTAPEGGTFAFSAAALLGPYDLPAGPIATRRGPLGPLYAGRLVELRPEQWRFIASRGEADAEFVGELTNPLPIRRDEQGNIVVDCLGVPSGAGQ